MEATPLSAFKITGTRIDGFVGEGITEVVIPEGIAEIQHHAFCPVINPAAASVQSVYIPDTVTIIGQNAFARAKNLIKVRLPSNLKKLEDGIFNGCENLQNICLPHGLQSIGFHAFRGTQISKIILPDTVTKLYDGAIAFCKNLKTIAIPESAWIGGKDVLLYSKNVTILTTAASPAELHAKTYDIPLKIITKAAMDELLISEREAFPKYPQLKKTASGKADQNGSKPDDIPDELRKTGLTIEDLDEILRRADEIELQEQAQDTPPAKESTNQYIPPQLKEINDLIGQLGQSPSTQEKEKNGFASIVDAGKDWLRQRNAPSKDDEAHYSELIRFVKFCKKIAPLAGGNYGITIKHEPKKNYGLFAAFGFYDLNEIQFAREYAVNKAYLPVSKSMVRAYYEDISKAASLRQEDWPFCMDGDAFWEALHGGGYMRDQFTVIPDEHCDDTFTIRVNCCSCYGNAGQVHASVIKLLNYHFPELNVKKGAVGPSSMHIYFKI